MGTKLKSRTLSLILADIFIIYGGIVLALTLRLSYGGAVAYLVEDEGRVNVALATIICLIALYFYGLYDYIVLNSRSEMKLLLIQAIGSAWVVLAIIYYFIPVLEVGRGTALYSIGITLVGLVALRSSIHYILGHPEFGEKLLLVGEGKVVQDLARAVDLRRDAGYRIVGYTSNNVTNGHADLPMIRNLGGDDDLENIVDANGVNRIIVGTRDRRGNFPVEPLLRLRLAGNVNIEDCSNFFERVTGQVHLDTLRPSWLIFSEHTRDTTLSVIIRDSAHWLAALVGLIVSLPVMAVTAILIKLESEGPVFYKQQRVGKNGTVFTLYKFRSMQADAEADGKPVWARSSDDRVTFVGRIIRKIRIDEIPQFWNILRREMSFVGPRPERPHFVAELAKEIPYYEHRHLVAPGLTGWAQIKYPYGASIEDARQKLQYDLYYIKNQTLLLDVVIFFETVKTILFGRGAR